MATPDLNLLVTLDVLLAEGSVARAAKRLGLSPSAMSRALARLRETTGDPLLVRAGRGLVATPRALQLRERVSQLVQEAEALLRPAEQPDLGRVMRTFTLRTREGFVENFGARLIARVAEQAPGIRLRFLPRNDKDSTALRDGTVDLETGVVGKATSPELCTQGLFHDRFIGVLRAGHPLSCGAVTPVGYASGVHIGVARRAEGRGPIDQALEAMGLARQIAATVAGFATALVLVRESDMIATVPERHTANLRTDMHSFELPVDLAPLTIAMLWHPRLDADPVHRWLRACLREVCSSQVTLGNLQLDDQRTTR